MINISFQCFLLLISILKIRFMNVKAQYSRPIFSRSCFNIEFIFTYNILAQYWVNIASMFGNVEKIGKFSLNINVAIQVFSLSFQYVKYAFLMLTHSFRGGCKPPVGGGRAVV